MSFVDYNARVEDHQSLLVLVRQIGSQASQKLFNKAFERISRVRHAKIKDSQLSGGQRSIWLRYVKQYPVESSEWGDFQSHRRVLGILTIGKCKNQLELEEICKLHSCLLEQYKTAIDSRCLVFGLNSDGNSTSSSTASSSSSSANTPSETTSSSEPSPSSLGDLPFEQGKCVNNGNEGSVFGPALEPEPKVPEICDDKDSGVYDQTDKSDPLQSNCEVDMADITFSLQNKKLTPESNSVFESADQPKSPSLNGSPQINRKQRAPFTGKLRSTQCVIYPSIDSCDKMEMDIYEFASSLFWVLESKRLDRSLEKQDKFPLLKAPFEKRDFVGLDTESRNFRKRCLGRMRKHLGDLSLQVGMPLEALSLYVEAIDILKSVPDWLWLASAYEGQCAASVIIQFPHTLHNQGLHRNSSFPLGSPAACSRVKSAPSQSRSLPNGIDPNEYKALGKSVLSLEEIIERLKDCTFHYSKYSNVSVIHTECNIKATRILVAQEKYLCASEFLQNAVSVNLPFSEQEKIDWYASIAHLYAEVGFHRKAAFFLRVAAVKCMSPQTIKPNPAYCYHLLLRSLNGYRLNLDPSEIPTGVMYGWPRIQIQMLQEMIYTARRMDNQPVAVRHSTFLLHALFQYLSPEERREICCQLEELTSNCEGSPVPLALDNGYILPPVNLLFLPLVRSFKPQNLAPHLRPVKITSRNQCLESENSSPFIFSPLQFHRNKKPTNNEKLDFKWIEGEVCAVTLQVFNPLPFELKVTHMSLLADGVAFESFPSCLELPPESNPYPVKLLGTPRGTGDLQILGYTTHVLGVKSNCRLKDLPAIKNSNFVIEVIPTLPHMEVSTSLPKDSSFSSLSNTSHVVINAAVTLYAGESQEFTITLSNVGEVPIEKIELTLQTKLEKDSEQAFFSWSKENLDTQLPILPEQSASFTLYIHAHSDFLKPVSDFHNDSIEGATASGPASRGCSASASPISTPQKRSAAALQKPFPEPFPVKVLEAVLQFQYSGGPGMEAKYCRQCGIALTVEVLSSVLFTKWDVLPAEVPTSCYLVLDMLNATNQEMELQYSENKTILIEANDTCRIPVTVERCPPPSQDSLQVDEESGCVKFQDLESFCKEHLMNKVDLQWTLPAVEKSGRANVSGVTWTASMLDNILLSPLLWEISLNGRPYSVEEEYTFKVGDPLLITISVHNISQTTLRDLYLSARSYQDYQNGNLSYRLESKCAIVGCDKIFIQEILPQKSCVHNFSLVFFLTGVYKLDIHCRSLNSRGLGSFSALAAAAVSAFENSSQGPAKEQRTSNVPYSGRSHEAPSAEESSHVWKCTPPIEVTIVDS